MENSITFSIDKFDTIKNFYRICIWISICNYRPVTGKYGKFHNFFHNLSKVRHLCNKFYQLFVMLMNLIGFDIENLSYNWSIITYRNSCTNSIWIFHCIKLANGNGNGIFQICANTLFVHKFHIEVLSHKYNLIIL